MKTSALHPFTPGTLALSAIGFALILPSAGAVLIGWMLLVAVIAAIGNVRAVLHAVLAVTPILVLLFVLQVIMGSDPRMAAPWGGTVSEPGLAWAVSQGSRLLLIATASLWFASQFDPYRFLQAAIAARWSFRAAFLVVGTLDAAQQLKLQAARIREAQRTRGLRLHGSVVRRARAVPALLFPLLLGVLTEADERMLALETRGLTLRTQRAPIDPPVDTRIQRLLRGVLLFAPLALLVWRIAR